MLNKELNMILIVMETLDIPEIHRTFDDEHLAI